MELDATQVVGINLINAEQEGNLLTIYREMVLADGSTVTGKHTFPVDALEWRAAEYGIDPSELDSLLDVVLWEPFLDEDDQPELALYEAESTAKARTHHLARIQKAKARGGAAGQANRPSAVRDRVLAMVTMNPEAVAIKQEMVGRTKQKVRAEKEAAIKARLRALVEPSSSQEELRLAGLRNMLKMDRSTTGKGRENGN